MRECLYKGFKICYEVTSQKNTNNKLFQAYGLVMNGMEAQDTPTSILQKFHTEFPTRLGAEKEIKKQLKAYIDFEWQEFYSSHTKK